MNLARVCRMDEMEVGRHGVGFQCHGREEPEGTLLRCFCHPHRTGRGGGESDELEWRR